MKKNGTEQEAPIKILNKEKEALEALLAQKKTEYDASHKKLSKLQYEFHQVKNSQLYVFQRRLLSFLSALKGKRPLSSNKEIVKKRIENIGYKMNELTFEEKGLAELKQMYENEADRYAKSLAALEIARWHCKQDSLLDAYAAIDYIQAAKQGLKEKDQTEEILKLEQECRRVIENKENSGPPSVNSVHTEIPLEQIFAVAHSKKNKSFRFSVASSDIESFDCVIATDFRVLNDSVRSVIEEITLNQKLGIKTGLIQLNKYFQAKGSIIPEVLQLINEDVQWIDQSDKAVCEVLIVRQPSVLQEKQKRFPLLKAYKVIIILDELPNREGKKLYDMNRCRKHVRDYTGKKGKWYPESEEIRRVLLKNCLKQLSHVNFSAFNWESLQTNDAASKIEIHASRMADCFVDKKIHRKTIQGDVKYGAGTK